MHIKGKIVEYILVLGPGYWGRGATEEEALEKAKHIKKKDPQIFYRITCLDTDDPPYVSDHGAICWHGQKETIKELNFSK